MTSFDSFDGPSFELLDALDNVISQAHADLASEERMDLAQEVAETVRHEHLRVYWRDRMGDMRQDLTLHILHDAIQTISGSVAWVTQDFLELYAATGRYLISVDSVWAISGLSASATISSPSELDAQFASIWLHNLCDQQVAATWFVGQETILTGHCLRIGPDAIDIEHKGTVVSLLSKKLCAVRISPGNY